MNQFFRASYKIFCLWREFIQQLQIHNHKNSLQAKTLPSPYPATNILKISCDGGLSLPTDKTPMENPVLIKG